MAIRESNGKHLNPNTGMEELIYCPVNECNCPYCKDGICYIADPMEDCDDWGGFWDSWEEWENA